MRDILAVVFNLGVLAGTLLASLWLHRRLVGSGIEKPIYWRLMILVVTYGMAFWMFFGTIFFGDDVVGQSAAGGIFQIAGDVMATYLIVAAPIVVLIIGASSLLARSKSIYHRVAYWGADGYALFLLAFFILAASRCSIPPGGIP